MDQSTNLEGIILGDGKKRAVSLADIRWNGVNFTVVDWKLLRDTGEGRSAEHHKTRLRYLNAARTGHQLAVALEDQGLSETAVPYAYRARVFQRRALILQALLRPAQNPYQRWIIRLLQLRGRKLRTWQIFALIIPLSLLLFSLLIILGNLVLVLQWGLAFLLGFLFVSVLFVVLPSLHKLVLLLIALTMVLPAIAALILAVLIENVAMFIQLHLSPTNIIVSFAPLIAILLTAVVSFVLYAFLARLAQNVERLRQGLQNWYLSYRSLYLLFWLTLGDYGRVLFSSFLDILAGYGYKPGKTIRNYLLVIIIFALFSWFIGNSEGVQAAIEASKHLHRTVAAVPVFSPLGALIYSIISFHGRGLFPGIGTRPDDPLVVIAAIEAVLGLVIEVSFIATFTQRFLSK